MDDTRQRDRTWPRVAVFYLVTMVGAGLLGILQPILGIDPVIIEITQFGPTLGVLAVAVCWRLPARGLLTGGEPAGRTGVVRALALLATPLMIMGLCVAGYAVLGDDIRFTAPGTLSESFPLIVVAQFVGACGEEFGWRCFLQPLLRTRFRAVPASGLVGLLWGCWHIGAFGYGPVYAVAFLAMAVAMSVVLGLALDRTGAVRLPLAGGFHALINLGMLLLMDEEAGAALPMVMLAVSALVVALLWVGWSRASMRSGNVVTVAGR